MRLEVRSACVIPSLIGALLVIGLAGPARAVPQVPGTTASEKPGHFDVHISSSAGLGRAVATHASTASVEQARAARARRIQTGLTGLRAASPGAEITASLLTGGVEVVKNDRGALTPTAPPGRAGLDIVLDFIRSHPDVYGLTPADINGLHFLGESKSRVTGIRMVRVEQRVNGLPIFQSDTRFVLDRDGRLIRSVGLLV